VIPGGSDGGDRGKIAAAGYARSTDPVPWPVPRLHAMTIDFARNVLGS